MPISIVVQAIVAPFGFLRYNSWLDIKREFK